MKPLTLAMDGGTRQYDLVLSAVPGGCKGCVAEHDNPLCSRLNHHGCLDSLNRVWKERVTIRPEVARLSHNLEIDMTREIDPTGRDPHAPGAKLDAGKVRPSLVIEGMARAILAVSEVATFGAAKYTAGGWVLVPNGQERYADAQYRHILKRAKGEQADADSTLDHLAHEAWNALAKLDLHLREKERNATA